MSRKILLILTMVILAICFSCNTFKPEDANPRKWTYFKIQANTEDDSLFFNVQEELSLDPKFATYILVVNITDKDSKKQCIVIGEETDPDSRMFPFDILSKRTQQGLINWCGINKQHLSRKQN
jgi:hypothetical protein